MDANRPPRCSEKNIYEYIRSNFDSKKYSRCLHLVREFFLVQFTSISKTSILLWKIKILFLEYDTVKIVGLGVIKISTLPSALYLSYKWVKFIGKRINSFIKIGEKHGIWLYND